MRTARIAMAVVAGLGSAAMAQAQEAVPTKVLVRVVAHDAKLIGSGVGGAMITIRDARSGRILAEGLHQGSTGDTKRIMVAPRERATTVFDTEGAAGFTATLELSKPTLVEVMAEGPLGTAHARQRASKTLLVVPGRHVLGEGVVLEVNGFTVVLETPEDDARVKAGEPLEVRANVTMLCGCPTTPGGLWNADQIEIVARVLQGSKLLAEVPLAFTGAESTYGALVTVHKPGQVTLQVLAMDPAMANFGMVERTVRVLER